MRCLSKSLLFWMVWVVYSPVVMGSLFDFKSRECVGKFIRSCNHPDENSSQQNHTFAVLKQKFSEKFPHTHFDCQVLARHYQTQRSLDLAASGLEDICVLECFQQLEQLYVSKNSKLDFSNLAAFKNLKILDASDTALKDLGFVSSLKNLRVLQIARTPVEILAPLESHHRLAVVDASETKVSDISALGSCPSLHTLVLSGSRVRDMTPLARMLNLEMLFLDGLELEDTFMLSGLQKLLILSLGENRITKLGGVSSLVNIKELSLRGNPGLSDITQMVQLRSLEVLSLTGTSVTDLSSLHNLPFLKIFFDARQQFWSRPVL